MEASAESTTATARTATAHAAQTAAPPAENATTVHEAYAFVCLSCGHGWENEYEIHHVTDLHGMPGVVYFSSGVRVPSPLTQPKCVECESTRVRFLRSGRVTSAQRPAAPRTRRLPGFHLHWHWHHAAPDAAE